MLTPKQPEITEREVAEREIVEREPKPISMKIRSRIKSGALVWGD